ncbi:S8 family peptidase [Hymenobacter guriensis]|uniref:S8 family serine peptidase n=1 Tax=Hymenobacter guriensis TaxID=2793065 RepID=A0ABS0L8T8_9BACT|nr:S8 family peptidase [Hymenobacter guriensis]MBG8555854.1 S8 family serine peptidase [Hymenobacter guriensis]
MLQRLLAFWLWVCAASCLLAGPATAQTAPSTLPGLLVFRLKPGAATLPAARRLSGPAWQKALRQVGATNVAQKFPQAQAPLARKKQVVDLRLVYQAQYPAHLPFAKARALLLQTGLVEYVEPLYQREPLYQPNDPSADSTRVKSVQYYLKNVRAYRAWDISKGDTNIVIGVLDTGTRFTHQDLKDQEKRNYRDPVDGIDNDEDGYVDNFRGWDMADNDNDPTADAAYLGTARGHGITVTGVAAARTDNGKGVAGAGFNCKYLPIKIYPSTPAGVFAGYEAIVYAADHGCQVINLSWGGVGGKSQYEQDIINYAVLNHDVVIVAAAGNTNAELDFYPASYEHVLSVAALEPNNQKGKTNTYSYHVDISAPGQQMLTTGSAHDSAYSTVGGSSLASPLVAGAVALVRAQYPDYSAEQVMARVRQTADSLYTITGNAAYRHKLGTGRLNMHRALAEPTLYAVQLTNVRYEPVPSFQPGDTTLIVAELQNLLAPVSNVRISLTTASPYVRIVRGSVPLGDMLTLSEAANALEPFTVLVAEDAPLATTAILRFHFEADNGYSSDQFVPVLLNPGFITLTAGNLHVSVTSQGNIGYDAINPAVGEGVSYRNGPSLLSIGGLLVATSPERVSDRLLNEAKSVDKDFMSVSPLHFVGAARGADQEIMSRFRDTLSDSTVGVSVRQRGFAWADERRRNYVVVEYTLTNTTADTLRPLYVGLYMDWDLPLANNRNAAGWDAGRQLGYVYDQLAPTLHAGVQLLHGGPVSTYAINNSAPEGAPVRLADGFSNAEKYLMLSSGTAVNTINEQPAGADVSHVVGAELPALAPGDSTRVAFAILGAGSLDSLQAAADVARLEYDKTVTPVRSTAAVVQWQVYPNPAAGSLVVEIPASFAARQLTLLDALGRPVRTWAWNGQPRQRLALPAAAGLYMLRLEGKGGVLTRKVLIRP